MAGFAVFYWRQCDSFAIETTLNDNDMAIVGYSGINFIAYARGDSGGVEVYDARSCHLKQRKRRWRKIEFNQ